MPSCQRDALVGSAFRRVPGFYARQAGFVLAATLWTMALIAVAAGYLAERIQRTRELAGLAQLQTQALIDLSGSRAEALYRLGTTPVTLYGLGRIPATAIALDDRRYLALGNTTLQFQDDRGLLNLNNTDDDRLGRFLGVMGVPAERRAALIDALRDYLDDDNFKRLNGAEAAEYQSAGLPPPRNAKLITPWEAERIYNWKKAPELWKGAGMEPLVTTSTSFSLNPNTAPWQLLATMRGMTPEGVQALLKARKLSPLVSAGQVQALTGVVISQDPFQPDMIALPADSVRITQQAQGMGWGWRYNVSLTPVSDFSPWRVDYFYRVELPPLPNVRPESSPGSAPPSASTPEPGTVTGIASGPVASPEAAQRLPARSTRSTSQPADLLPIF